MVVSVSRERDSLAACASNEWAQNSGAFIWFCAAVFSGAVVLGVLLTYFFALIDSRMLNGGAEIVDLPALRAKRTAFIRSSSADPREQGSLNAAVQSLIARNRNDDIAK